MYSYILLQIPKLLCIQNISLLHNSYVYHVLAGVSVTSLILMSVERVLVVSLPASGAIRASHWCHRAVGVNVAFLALLCLPFAFMFKSSNGCFLASGPRALMNYYHTCLLMYVAVAVIVGPGVSLALIARVRQTQRLRLEYDTPRKKAESLLTLELGAIAFYTASCVILNVFWVTKGAFT